MITFLIVLVVLLAVGSLWRCANALTEISNTLKAFHHMAKEARR